MSPFFNRRSIALVLVALALVTQLGAASKAHATGATREGSASTQNNSPLCQLAQDPSPLSDGALEYCLGAQGSSIGDSGKTVNAKSHTFGSNINAANPAEDTTPSGVHVNGQAETSIASIGRYVVEAWNDVTGFISPCPSPMFKEELTGFGFSADGGASFTDEGGLPNSACTSTRYFGDPSVEAWQSGGVAYFYISSLFRDRFGLEVALAACSATGTGSAASISCSQPILAARSGNEDKEFLSIDPVRGRLYVSYTDFRAGSRLGQIELAVCDIGTPGGGTGPVGGTAGAPICIRGASSVPYLVVAHATSCVNQGSYPAVDVATGDVYVAWEFNWISNFRFGPPCITTPTQEEVAFLPFTSCLALPLPSCAGPLATNSVPNVSMDVTPIPGYSRPSPNDFPRIAVSIPFGTVSIVWNDAGSHPLGDILLQSFKLVSLTLVQASPVQLNKDVGGLHFLPALRNTDDDGDLQVSWYERAAGNTALTSVFAVIDVSPLTTRTPASNISVTTVATDWLTVSSVFTAANFGDYTDNYIQAKPCSSSSNNPICTTQTDYVAWSDGRIGVPQPFEAHAHTV